MIGVADGAKQLASIDITHLKSSTVKMNKARRQGAPDFGPFFSSLVGVITAQEKKLRARQASQQNSTSMSSGSTIPTRKRSPPSSDSIDGKRIKQTNESSSPHSDPKTPDQPTHPSDPDWSGGTDSSNDEEYTKMLLRDLLLNIREFLDEEFIGLLGKEVVMKSTSSRRSFPIFTLLTHRTRDSTKFRLGMQTIIAINDGGLGVRYNTGQDPVDWQPGGIRPVLALEVSVYIL